jgi:cobalt/nickel transport system permease protein
MHMADALLSPAVGGTMWGVAGGAIAYSSMRVKRELDDRRVPLMGVLGAFIFAAQMINFTIPATGSSGHLGGGLLLTLLLGPHAAFLTIASVLVVQSLFFADGGILALGCNIFNLGFFPAFVAYPLIYRPIAGSQPGRGRLTAAAVAAAVAGLQLGAFAVVLETVASGISSLPFTAFVTLMQPIHLAIGIVEGVVTASVVAFVAAVRPEIIAGRAVPGALASVPLRNIFVGFLAAALLTGGILSRFASDKPDGLEWAIAGVTGAEEVAGAENGLHGLLAALQDKIALLPDYSLPEGGKATDEWAGLGHPAIATEVSPALGTSVAGGLGAAISLFLAFGIGFLLKRVRSQE